MFAIKVSDKNAQLWNINSQWKVFGFLDPINNKLLDILYQDVKW